MKVILRDGNTHEILNPCIELHDLLGTSPDDCVDSEKGYYYCNLLMKLFITGEATIGGGAAMFHITRIRPSSPKPLPVVIPMILDMES